MCPLAGRWFGADVGLRGRGLMVAHCLLVETARDGLVLIDTGFGTRDCTGATPMSRAFKTMVGPTLAIAETALAQLEALGFSASDLRHIVVTHLDIDHAGGLSDFPHAKVHLHTREHAQALGRATLRDRERYVQAHWAHRPQWELYEESGDTWRGLPAIAQLRGLDADIGLVPMHGHTRGHSAVLVQHAGRSLLHAGDAYFHHGSIDGSDDVPLGFRVFERAVQTDARARRASLAALRQLRARYADVDIFSAHDPSELAALRARATASAAVA